MRTPKHLAVRSSGRWLAARRIVQTAALLLFARALARCAGWGLFGLVRRRRRPRSHSCRPALFRQPFVFTDRRASTLLDPFAVLQVAAASKTFALDWLWFALPILVFYGLVRGRAFCGWVCPVNLLLEGVDALRRKLGIEGARGARAPPCQDRGRAGACIVAVGGHQSVPAVRGVLAHRRREQGHPLRQRGRALDARGHRVLRSCSGAIACGAAPSARSAASTRRVGRIGRGEREVSTAKACIHCDACSKAPAWPTRPSSIPSCRARRCACAPATAWPAAPAWTPAPPSALARPGRWRQGARRTARAARGAGRGNAGAGSRAPAAYGGRPLHVQQLVRQGVGHQVGARS